MEGVSLKEVSLDSKIRLLKALGYDSDGKYVLDANRNKIIERYLQIPVEVENMVIFPKGEVILYNNELSISEYFEEFGDVF